MAVILVLGRSGQIATELARLAPPEGCEIVSAGRERFDLGQTGAARALIDTIRPALVINAAAYTAVDKAETEEDVASRINAAGAGEAAQACAASGAALVHYSTDYVFDGAKPSPYVETDPIAPLGAYGRTKAAGEADVSRAGARAAIVRTSWVYSAHGANFVKTMLRLAETRDEIGVVADQRGGPTWAKDAAEAGLALGLRLLSRDAAAEGIFHYSSVDFTSWNEFAKAIFEQARRRGLKIPTVKSLTTADYPTLARRPANSQLDCTKIAKRLGIPPRLWRDSLAACLSELLPEGLS